MHLAGWLCQQTQMSHRVVGSWLCHDNILQMLHVERAQHLDEWMFAPLMAASGLWAQVFASAAAQVFPFALGKQCLPTAFRLPAM
jgi:hypothetical protein